MNLPKLRSTASAFVFVGLLISIFNTSAFARPEYAARQRVDCLSCHATPWGGGPRTIYGKIYGSKNLGSPTTNFSDVYYADMRVVGFYPPNPSSTANGVALMEIAPSVNLPILTTESGSELRGVATYNFAPLASGAREVYIRFRPTAEDTDLMSHIVVGRFNQPFGLLTDEHRTYTKLQTNSTFNTFVTGVAASGNILPSLRYHLAATNDLQGNGLFTNNDFSVGEVFNLRWMPEFYPGILGVSQNFQYLEKQTNRPLAFSLYTVISLERLTNEAVSASLSGEVVSAKNWDSSSINPGLGPFFIPPSFSTYQPTLADSRSLGYMAMAKYNLSNRWTLLYKYDYLALNESFKGDAFSRHGAGFQYTFNSNSSIDVRIERAFVGRPEISGSTAFGAEDDLLMMLRVWL